MVVEYVLFFPADVFEAYFLKHHRDDLVEILEAKEDVELHYPVAVKWVLLLVRGGWGLIGGIEVEVLVIVMLVIGVMIVLVFMVVLVWLCVVKKKHCY